MERVQRTRRLVLLAGLAAAWLLGATGGPAGAQVPTPEPPLAGTAGTPAPPLRPVPSGGAAPAAREPGDPAVPTVSLRVRVPARAEPGKELEYRLQVENCSKAAAHHVVVRDRLPHGARFIRANPEPKSREPDLVWDLGTLTPCVKKEIVVVIVPGTGSEVENHAFVQFEHGQTVRTRINRPELRLRVLAPPRVPLHEPVNFQLEVTNAGLVDAADVVLKDELPAELKFLTSKPSTTGENPLTWKLGALAAGQSRRVEYSAASLSAGTFADHAEVTAAGGVRQEASAYVQVGERLLVAKSGPERRLVRRLTTYQITVTNTGKEPAANVQVANQLPRDITFVNATGDGKLVGDRIRWSLGTLAPGARRSVQVAVRASTPGKFKNVTEVTADGGLSAWHAVWTQFEEAAGPVVEIDKGEDPFEVGRPGTCLVRVLNPGTAPAAVVGLTVRLPDDWRVLRAGGRTTGRQGTGVVRFDPLPTLAAGEEVEYTVEVQATKPGPAPLRAELTTAAASAPLVWEEMLTAEAAATPPAPAPGKPGGL
jgi:uncharacterized repeat protein (TIGR01451 family)